jgi:SAM-dependent methyltransferase
MAWFKEWFDSPYYHLLYEKRDDKEAVDFLTQLFNNLTIEPSAKLLDLACGNGRHSRTMAQLGYNTVGVDLSPNNIQIAKQIKSDLTHFFVHDMRQVFKKNEFDAVLNLFTSFGYFVDKNDNIQTLNSVYENLKPGAIFVQDFLNAESVIKNLVEKETINRGDVVFEITRTIIDQQIIKNISFEVGQETYEFSEEVTLFTLSDFEQMYQKVGFKIKHFYGDYQLNTYNPSSSDRLILISEKI